MKKLILQQINGRLLPAAVNMTAEEEAALVTELPKPEVEDTRLDDIEAALMELASLVGGGE